MYFLLQMTGTYFGRKITKVSNEAGKIQSVYNTVYSKAPPNFLFCFLISQTLYMPGTILGVL